MKEIPGEDQVLDWEESVLDKDLTAPPGAPTTGDRYIVGPAATGLWSGKDNDVAEWDGGNWVFTTPTDGTTTFVEDENSYYTFDGSSWNPLVATPALHAASHQDTGADEINVANLSGVLADKQDANKLQGFDIVAASPPDGSTLVYDGVTDNQWEYSSGPPAHASKHENAGSDEISVADLSGKLADAQKTTVRRNSGANVGTRPRLNFIEGTSIALTIVDDGAGDEIDITIDASAAGTDILVKVSVDDTTAGYLLDKIVGGNGITLTETNPGGDEDLTLSVTESDLSLANLGTRTHASLSDAPEDAHHAKSHGSTHQENAADEFFIEQMGTFQTDTSYVISPDGTGGLSFSNYTHAELASVSEDQHHPKLHESTHETGGGDALTGNIDAIARTSVAKNSGAVVGSRRELNFIEDNGVTLTIADDAGNEEVDITISLPAESKILYVGKHGNDTWDGQTIHEAYLTFGAAITQASSLTPSSSNIISIIGLDGGVYAEAITVPSWVHVYAPDATINGANQIEDDCSLTIYAISLSVGTCISKLSGAGVGSVRVKYITASGTANAVLCGLGTLQLQVDYILVSGTGYGVGNSLGDTNAIVNYINVTASGGEGVVNNNVGTLNINVGKISAVSGAKAIELTSTGTANVTVGELNASAGTAYDVGASATLNLFCNTLSGTETVSGTLNRTRAGFVGQSANDIHVITLKGTPVSADEILIEDSAASWAKKRATLSSLPGGSDVNVKVSSNDTTTGYLIAKITGGDGISIQEIGDGGDEDLDIDLNLNELTEEVAPASGDMFVMWDGVNHLKVDYDNLPGGGTDVKVKVTTNDTTANFLLAKMAAGTAISLVELNDGADEDVQINVVESGISLANLGTRTHASLSDAPTDAHHAKLHQADHQSGGADPLAGNLDATGRVKVSLNSGAVIGTRRELNLIEGKGIEITVVDDAGSEEVDITFIMDIPNLTEETDVDDVTGADYLAIYDGSAATHKKVILDNMKVGASHRTWFHARKGSIGTITKGSPVYISGWNVGGYAEVEEADADSAMPAMGIANEALTNAATGEVVSYGLIENIATSSWSVGDGLFVSETVGTLTNVRPAGAVSSIQPVATVIRSHASLGIIFAIGAGKINDTGNLTSDYFWLGASNVKAEFRVLDLPVFVGQPVTADWLFAWDTDAGVHGRMSLADINDPTAFHTDVLTEIKGVTVKGTPVAGDVLLIEDSAASWAKKSITISTLPAGTHTLDGGQSDVTITTVATGETLIYTGAGWENQTLVEATIVSYALFDAQTVLVAVTDNTPTALTVGVQTVVGRLTAGNVAAIAIGITDNDILQVDGSPNSAEYARFTANGIEGRTVAEAKTDLGFMADLVDDTTPQLGGNVGLNAKGFMLESQTKDAGASTGDLTYYDGVDWNQTDADAEATASQMLGILLSTTTVLTYGIWTTTGLTAGSIYYVSTTPGAITTTAPSGTGDIVRIIGYALSTTQLMFMPDNTFVEI